MSIFLYVYLFLTIYLSRVSIHRFLADLPPSHARSKLGISRPCFKARCCDKWLCVKLFHANIGFNARYNFEFQRQVFALKVFRGTNEISLRMPKAQISNFRIFKIAAGNTPVSGTLRPSSSTRQTVERKSARTIPSPQIGKAVMRLWILGDFWMLEPLENARGPYFTCGVGRMCTRIPLVNLQSALFERESANRACWKSAGTEQTGGLPTVSL